MEMTATLLATGRVEVAVREPIRDRILFRDVEQMEEFSRLMAREAERIRGLVPPKRPRYKEKKLFD